MEMYILIIVCYIISISAGLYYFRKPKRLPVPSNDYATLMTILDESIKREIAFKYDDYKIRDVKIIYDFEDDLSEVVKKIMASFSVEYLEELYYYHPRHYILSMITRQVTKFLIQYTQQNKIKTK